MTYQEIIQLFEFICTDHYQINEFSTSPLLSDFEVGNVLIATGIRFTKNKYKENDYTSLIKTNNNEFIYSNTQFDESIKEYLFNNGLHPKNYINDTLNKKLLIKIIEKKPNKFNAITVILDISENV